MLLAGGAKANTIPDLGTAVQLNGITTSNIVLSPCVLILYMSTLLQVVIMY